MKSREKILLVSCVVCVLIAATFLYIGCREQSTRTEYIKITPQEAQYMIAGSDDVIILDVRTQEEFEQGHIPDAVLLPVSEIVQRADTIIADKNAIILVYCRSGGRSETAARGLIAMGYTRVYDFGGIMDWHGDIVS